MYSTSEKCDCFVSVNSMEQYAVESAIKVMKQTHQTSHAQ